MRSPRPSPALVLVLTLSMPACGPTTACPAGTSLVGVACVAPDASPNLPDGGRDANIDAPMPDAHVPCGGARDAGVGRGLRVPRARRPTLAPLGNTYACGRRALPLRGQAGRIIVA